MVKEIYTINRVRNLFPPSLLTLVCNRVPVPPSRGKLMMVLQLQIKPYLPSLCAILCACSRRGQAYQSQPPGLHSGQNHFLWPLSQFPLVWSEQKMGDCKSYQLEQGEPEVLSATLNVPSPREHQFPKKEHKVSTMAVEEGQGLAIRELIGITGGAYHNVPDCPGQQGIQRSSGYLQTFQDGHSYLQSMWSLPGDK